MRRTVATLVMLVLLISAGWFMLSRETLREFTLQCGAVFVVLGLLHEANSNLGQSELYSARVRLLRADLETFFSDSLEGKLTALAQLQGHAIELARLLVRDPRYAHSVMGFCDDEFERRGYVTSQNLMPAFAIE